MRICFFLGDIQGNGGISRVTWILANRLCADNEVYVLANWKNNAKRYIYKESVHLSCLFDDHKSNLERFIPLVKGVKRFVKANNIDVLICAGEIYYPICVIATRNTNTKLLCWEHSNVSVKSEHRFQGMCRWIGAKNADYIVPLTLKDEELYKQKYKISNVRAIYNPVDDTLLRDVSYDTHSKLIISVGRLCDQKNFELLIDVAKQVLDRHKEWAWHIYGEGEKRKILEQKIRAYSLEDRLILKGRVDDLYDRYHNYSFLVMTSKFEGFPMTLLEATALGIPQISFDILTGPNEIIENAKTGYLIKAFDTTEMINKINCLITKPEIRIEMSNNCLGKRVVYSCEEIEKQWRDLLSFIGE